MTEPVARDDTAFDPIARDLQQLRQEAGAPSYNDIVVRIARERETRGVPEAAARPARTTVYDAFRLGRRRLDPDLVGEIVRALGVPEADSVDWEERVRRARSAQAGASAAMPEPVVADPAGTPLAARLVVLILVGSVTVNLVGRALVDYLELSIYLDMVGTAVAAIVLGPWWGVGVGLTTNLLGTAVSGPLSIPFGLVNAAGALVWGYGVRRFGFGRTLPRFFLLNLLAGLTCTLVAAPIIVALGGETHHRSDALVDQVQALLQVLLASVLAINLLMSLIDKTLSGFVALVVADLAGRPVEHADVRRHGPHREDLHG